MSQATDTTRRASRPEPFIQPLAYTMDQAAIACGRSKKQLYRDIAQGLLRTYKHGRRRMVTVQEMERHVARLARGQYGHCIDRGLSPLMDPAPQQIGVDAVSHCHSGHRDARLLRGLHCLRLELGAVNSPSAAWRCLIHSAYVPIKSLMDTSILGTAQRINMTSLAAYG